MREPVHFGRHTVSWEEPGIAVIKYRGWVSEAEMRAMADLEDQSEHGGKLQLTLCYLDEFDGMNSAARKAAAERPRPAEKYFNAFIGASFAMRVFVGMWSKATNFLQGEKNVVAFFDDHASARAWLLEQRARCLGK